MRTPIHGLLAIMTLGLALSTNGARLEDLESMLKGVSEGFRSMVQSDAQLSELRNELIAPATPIERKRELFKSYRERLAEQIERQQGLVERVQGALDAAQGLPDETGANFASLVAGFDDQAAAWEAQIRQLQVNAEALARKDGIAGQMASLQKHNLALLQQQFQAVRQARQKLSMGSAGTGVEQLRDMLQALHATAVARETAMHFEFTVTSQNARIFDAVTEVRSLYEQLIGPQDYADYMRQIGNADVEAANAMVQMSLMVSRSIMPVPEMGDEKFAATDRELVEMKNLMPYEVSGEWYCFSPAEDRWYILDAEGSRVMLPIDPMANTGRHVRMHADGRLYSEAPWYDRPRQLTFTDDWRSELDGTAPAGNSTK